MDIKLGKSGKFLSCKKYPDCDGALTIEGQEIGNEKPIGQHSKTGEDIYVLSGRFGPFVQLGPSPDKKDKKAPKPRRASLPKGTKPEDVTIELAERLLALPRELGEHPDDKETVIANIGRFGPYVGHGREFRSIKKSSGLDPYTITLEEALKILAEPKALPKGVELVRIVGKHPKTGKDIQLLKSKSGMFVKKGLKRLYLPDNADPEKVTLDEVLDLLKK